MVDPLGKHLLTRDLTTSQGNNVFVLDASTLAPGTYLLRAQSVQRVLCKKFVYE